MKNLRRGNYFCHYSIRLACAFIVALWCIVLSTPVWAHKVTLFAWVEGDTVHTQSKFSGGKVAKNSMVVVYDKEGAVLLEGKTDESGAFSFKIPKKTELKVVLKASMGHLAEWIIPVDEMTADLNPGDGTDSSERAVPQTDGHDSAARQEIGESGAEDKAKQHEPSDVGLSKQEIKELIDTSLDRKMAPLIQMLAQSTEHGTTMSEVIGGIGYIFGLVGVGLYFSNRRKKG